MAVTPTEAHGSAIRDLCENYYRSLILTTQSNGLEAGFEVTQRFEEMVAGLIASASDPLAAAAIAQLIDAERARLLAEFTASPAKLKQRLGLPLGVDAPVPMADRQRDELGELVVKTAVRATVWEGVWALFRAFR